MARRGERGRARPHAHRPARARRGLYARVRRRDPALFVPVPFVRKVTTGPHFTLVAGLPGTERIVVVMLDRGRMQRQLLEPLLAKYFGDPRSPEYLVTVAGTDPAAAVLFNSGGAA